MLPCGGKLLLLDEQIYLLKVELNTYGELLNIILIYVDISFRALFIQYKDMQFYMVLLIYFCILMCL